MVAISFLFASALSAQHVKTHYDRSTNFAKYKTYSWEQVKTSEPLDEDLVPSKIGTVSGLFFGLAFGLGGIGAALLGKLADHTSINFVHHVCALLPALGILTAFLPDLSASQRSKKSD
jgi:hypothetical protein